MVETKNGGAGNVVHMVEDLVRKCDSGLWIQSPALHKAGRVTHELKRMRSLRLSSATQLHCEFEASLG